jgi:type I restriction enzyme S subunit
MGVIKYRKMEEMKDSGIEWLGEIPRDWVVMRNKNIFSYRRRTFNRIADTTVLSLTKQGVKVKTDLSFGKSTESYIGHQLVKKGELIFTPRDFDATPILSGIAVANGCISNLYFVLKTNDLTTENYVNYYWWGLKYGYNYFKEFAYGIRFSFNQEQFFNIPFLFAQTFEQQKIANFLDIKTAQFDSIISKKELLIQKLEEAKNSLISEVVTGKVKIVDGEMVKRHPEEMKDSGVEWLGMIPKEWVVKRNKFFLRESGDRSLYGKEEQLSMSQKYGLIKSSDMARIPNQALSFKGNKICKKGDLVFNKLKSHLGVFSVANQKGIVSPDYAVYRSNGNINTKYLEYLFKTPIYINQFNRYSKGVGEGLTRLYTDDLFNIVSLYPDLNEQKEIENIINDRIGNMDEIIRKFSMQIQKLKQAKQSLISEAVTGKIDLRDWEIVEEGAMK